MYLNKIVQIILATSIALTSACKSDTSEDSMSSIKFKTTGPGEIQYTSYDYTCETMKNAKNEIPLYLKDRHLGFISGVAASQKFKFKKGFDGHEFARTLQAEACVTSMNSDIRKKLPEVGSKVTLENLLAPDARSQSYGIGSIPCEPDTDRTFEYQWGIGFMAGLDSYLPGDIEALFQIDQSESEVERISGFLYAIVDECRTKPQQTLQDTMMGRLKTN